MDAIFTSPAQLRKTVFVGLLRWGVLYVFWFVGSTDLARYEQAKREKKLNTIPSNHSPKFAPVLHPTMATGLQAMLTAASAWLCAAAQ